MIAVWWVLVGCGPSQPDVIVISVDTLRADRLGFMGHGAASTPRLDALASSGVVFTQATTPLPRTTPALSSLQTGLLPMHHGSREVGQPMAATNTLASALANRGYRTVGVSAMTVASAEQHLDRGFRWFTLNHDAPATELVAQTLSIVGTLPRGPLYLWVHLSDPHFPYLPDPSGPVHPGPSRCRQLGEQARAGKLKQVTLFSNRGGIASRIRPDCLALYDAEISAVDLAVGQLLDGLVTRRGGRSQWIVFTADHGENQGEAGLFYEHGPNVHDASLRVPLVIAGPGLTPRRDDGVARLQDVAPTLLAELGATSASPLDGVPLGSRLRGEGGGPELLLAESGSALQAGLSGVLVSGTKSRWCINDGRWSWCKRGPRASPGLYDNTADVDLKNDLQAAAPAMAERLRAAAALWPPESARERTVRTATHKLVARPQLEGGYALTLYGVDDQGSDTPVEAPEVQRLLEAALAPFAAELDGTPMVTDRSEADIEALRALGYLE